MKIQDVLKEELIIFDAKYESKSTALEAMITILEEKGMVSNKKQALEAIYEREAIAATGMGNGLAIPHGKTATVSEPLLLIAKIDEPITDWGSIDKTNKVDLIFLILLPVRTDATVHLQILGAISAKLGSLGAVEKLKSLPSKKAFINFFTEDEKPGEVAPTKGFLLAITACSTGIAHTYMAATALEEAATRLGYAIKVEKQGASGIEDRLGVNDVKRALGIIFAADVAVKDKQRFSGLPFVQVNVSEPLKRADQIIQSIMTTPQGVVAMSDSNVLEEEATGFTKRSYQAIMTGISYMIPVLVGAGLMTGIAKLMAMSMGWTNIIISADLMAQQTNQFLISLYYLDKFGGLLLLFIYPIFGMFVAYSLADRPGLIPGFASGILAAGIHSTMWGIKGAIPSGFMGALILSIAVGFVADFLNKKIRVSKNMAAIKPMLIIPGVTLLCLFIINYLLVEPVFGWINQSLQHTIKNATDLGKYGLSAIIAGLTAFDLGGPVNKAAGAVAIPLATEKIFPLTPRVLSIVIPPIGLGLATVLDKFIVGRRVFDEDLRVTGSTSLVLGFIAVSEGAIPFMLKNPFVTIPLNILGAIFGSWVAIFLGAEQWLPLPAIWGWPLATNVPAYIAGVLCGALFIAISNILVRFYLIKRKEK
ncbi:MAG: PTS fructose transporter subunit IIABC [Culicoidibacterales bacterium]